MRYTVKDDLTAARALIDTPEKWGKGHEIFSPPTRKLCADLALGAACKPSGRRYVKAWSALLRASNGRDPVQFNDDPATTHADVLAMFDRAIEAAS